MEPHLQYQTKFSRDGERDMRNRKPPKHKPRPKVEKDLDGAYRVRGRLDRKIKSAKQ